jgi:MFS family permease
MRRLLIFASAMVFFDVVFFAAIAPLLPDYVAEFDLSKAEAGILTASYAAGTLLASIPAGVLATRKGPRSTVIMGLLLLGCGSLAFGFANDIALLDLARFAQGVAGALIWSGALTWLITTAPPERRGSVIGTALGTAIGGALFGPALGGLAAEVGTEPVFSAVFVVALAFAALATRMPEPGPPERQDVREVATAVFSRPVLMVVFFVTVPSLTFGIFEVLLPLEVHDLGGGHALIAGAWVAAAAIEAVLAPIAGHFSDRIGGRTPFVAGLGACAVAMVLFALANALPVAIAGLLCASIGAGLCFAPVLTMLSKTAEASNLPQGYAAALANIAWASGQVLGGIAGAGAASAVGNEAPSFVVVVMLLMTAVLALRFLAPAASRSVEMSQPVEA